MTGLARRTGWSIRAVRTVLEVTVLVIGLVLGGIAGVGTLLFALAIGPLTRFSCATWWCRWLSRGRATDERGEALDESGTVSRILGSPHRNAAWMTR